MQNLAHYCLIIFEMYLIHRIVHLIFNKCIFNNCSQWFFFYPLTLCFCDVLTRSIHSNDLVLIVRVPRFWQVLHHDGLRGAAWPDSSPLQLPVQQDSEGDAGGRELHGGSLLHGDLQREGPRPAWPKRVRTVCSRWLWKGNGTTVYSKC